MCPAPGLTMAESMGLADKSQRFSNTDGTHMAWNAAGCGIRANRTTNSRGWSSTRISFGRRR